MRVIGIDPGTVVCGYGIVESGDKAELGALPTSRQVKSQELSSKLKNPNSKLQTPNSKLYYVASGDIKLKKQSPLPDRLKVLHDSLNTIIKEYDPSHLCLEKIFYHKSIRSAFALGSTRGVVMLSGAQHDLPVFEYNPTEVKMALTGYGRAEKRQVQEMVKVMLNLDPSHGPFSEDSTDALALCICHINSSFKLQYTHKK